VHRVDDAAEFDNGAVAGALNDPAAMHDDGRIDQVALDPAPLILEARARKALIAFVNRRETYRIVRGEQ
jgi:hypothetical protein